MEHRTNEIGLLPFRTSRIFNVGSEWYFAVRGGKDYGPFLNQQDAESELDEFLSGFQLQKAH